MEGVRAAIVYRVAKGGGAGWRDDADPLRPIPPDHLERRCRDGGGAPHEPPARPRRPHRRPGQPEGSAVVDGGDVWGGDGLVGVGTSS